MKLLLDEMISAVVAEQLRVRERDVAAVSERRELRGLPDLEVFEYAQSAERLVATYNRDDFLELDRRCRGEGRSHSGIVVLNPTRFRQGPASIGPLVESLDELIRAGRCTRASFTGSIDQPAHGWAQTRFCAQSPGIHRRIRESEMPFRHRWLADC